MSRHLGGGYLEKVAFAFKDGSVNLAFSPIGGQKFRVHKSVLGSRSTVFDGMFKDSTEKVS